MPNPAGTQPLNPTPGYGEVKKLTQLTREAPMSGAPMAAHALQTPRRSGRQATRGKPTPEPQPVSVTPPPSPSTQSQVAQIWQAIAQTPGASNLVQQYAAEASG